MYESEGQSTCIVCLQEGCAAARVQAVQCHFVPAQRALGARSGRASSGLWRIPIFPCYSGLARQARQGVNPCEPTPGWKAILYLAHESTVAPLPTPPTLVQGVRHLRMRLFDYVNTSSRRWAWLSWRAAQRLPASPSPAAAAAAAAAAGNLEDLDPLEPPNHGVVPAWDALTVLPGSDAVVQPGFLAHVLPRHLLDLETLHITRSTDVMALRDYRALGCLTRLCELTVINHVRRHLPYPCPGGNRCASVVTCTCTCPYPVQRPLLARHAAGCSRAGRR